MDNDYKSHFEVYTVKQDTDETRSLSFDSRRRSRQQIFSEMPFHKFLIVVVGYYTSREISVQRLGAYRLNYQHKSQEYFEDTCGHHRSIRCVEEVIQKPLWHNAESLIVVGWLEKAFYCLYESSTSSIVTSSSSSSSLTPRPPRPPRPHGLPQLSRLLHQGRFHLHHLHLHHLSVHTRVALLQCWHGER